MTSPLGTGFGSKLVERGLAQELGGQTRTDSQILRPFSGQHRRHVRFGGIRITIFGIAVTRRYPSF